MKTLLSISSLLLFVGCARPIQYIDRVVEVKVPVKCITPTVAKAEGYNTSNYLINIFKELDLLREANKVCK